MADSGKYIKSYNYLHYSLNIVLNKVFHEYKVLKSISSRRSVFMRFFSFLKRCRVPKSNFLSTGIFNFNHVSFLFGIFCHFLKTSSLHWVSATKESLFCQKRVFFYVFVTNSTFPLSHWLSATNKIPWKSNKCQPKKNTLNNLLESWRQKISL